MDTERKVSQLDEDVREICDMVQKLDDNVVELRAMVRRQGNRLDSLEANVAQLADDVATLKVGQDRIIELLPGHQDSAG